MSSEQIILEAQKREVTGKKVSSLRNSGQLPATIYEKGKPSQNIQVEFMPMTKAWQAAGKHHTIELVIDGKKHLTMIKDIARDPVKATLSHVSFHAINKNDAIEAEVPLHMVGQAPASVMGLLVRLNVDHITVKGLPNDMPDSIEIDVTAVTTEDDDIRASSLIIPSNVTPVNLDPEMVVVSVTVPRAEVEKQADEEVDASEVPSDHGAKEAAQA